jgi:hypothetical protein
MYIDSHMIIHVKSLCHFNVRAKSHGELCDVYILRNFLFNLYIYINIYIKVGVCDLWKHFHLIELNCCMNVKFHEIKLRKEMRFEF